MLNIQNLTKHTGVGKSYVVKVSLSKRGMISITDGAVRRYGLADKDWAVLYYDNTDNIVVIEPKAEKVEDALKLRKRTTGAYIAAQSFVGNFQIELKGTTVCELKRDAESGFLYFELNTGKVRKGNQNEEL